MDATWTFVLLLAIVALAAGEDSPACKLPAAYAVDGKAVIKYGGTTLEFLKEQTKAATSSAPTVTWSCEANKKYTLIMFDPDAPNGAEGDSNINYGHWAITNIPSSSCSSSGGNTILQYGGPRPPAGTHRYIFLIYKQNEDNNAGTPERANFPVSQVAGQGSTLIANGAFYVLSDSVSPGSITCLNDAAGAVPGVLTFWLCLLYAAVTLLCGTYMRA